MGGHDGGGDGAGGDVYCGVGGGGGGLEDAASEETDAEEIVHSLGGGTPDEHSGAYHGEEDLAVEDAEGFEVVARVVELGFFGGLGGAKGAGDGGEYGDGGAERDEGGFGGLVGKTDSEVAEGVELFFDGAGGDGFAATGEEEGIGDALVSDGSADGDVPGFDDAISIGIGFAGEAEKFVVEGKGGAFESGFDVGGDSLASIPCGAGRDKFAVDGGKAAILTDCKSKPGFDIGDDFAGEDGASDGSGDELVFGVFRWVRHGVLLVGCAAGLLSVWEF